ATEVALDVIVRDKKGKPVKGLTAADFQVLEDGVQQRIESFRFVTREATTASEPASPSTTMQPGAKAPSRTGVPATERSSPGMIALVFDRLSPDARSLARKAGLAYSQEGMAGGDFTGVFRIDQSLITLQPFTDN